jgi:transcriptional regulator with XRE-family HTH domain
MARRHVEVQADQLARDARELTQAELASKSGLTQAFISKLEHGLITQPGEDALSQISRAVGFPPSFFFSTNEQLDFRIFITENAQNSVRRLLLASVP